jgi:uncharacterized protein YrzB (UPF0473 family)
MIKAPKKETAMDDKQNYGDDYVTITDEEGNTYELEKVSEEDIEIGDKVYRAFLPVGESEDDYYEMILFRVVEEDGEELLEIIEDEDEMERVYEVFMDRLFEDEDE